jgi:cytochrome b
MFTFWLSSLSLQGAEASTTIGAVVMSSHQAGSQQIKVWDIGVRLFHWTLVTSVILAYFLISPRWVHKDLGYLVMALLVFRLIWGVVGSQHARFSSFIPSPQALWRYLGDMLKRREQRFLGHNPAGAAMIVVLLLTLTAIVGTGIMMGTHTYFGEEWVEELHKTMVNVLLILVVFHVGGVVFSSLRHRENLPKSMITGTKISDE